MFPISKKCLYYGMQCSYLHSNVLYNILIVEVSDRPGVRFQQGPEMIFLAGAGGNNSGRDRGRGFLVKIWSPVQLAEVMKLFENLEKIVILLVVEIFLICIENEI